MLARSVSAEMLRRERTRHPSPPTLGPLYRGDIALEDERRSDARFRALGLSWAKARTQLRTGTDAAKLALERVPHQRDGERKLTQDELSLEPEHAVARASEGAVPPLVSAASAGVIAAVDFNHEVSGGRAKVYDEVSEHHLPLETDAELATGNSLPEALFRRRERRAHGGRAGCEQLRASDVEIAFLHGSLLVPGKWPGVAPLGAGSVTRARRVPRAVTARGAERAPLGAARPLRRDEVRGEHPSIRVQSVQPLESTKAQPVAKPNRLACHSTVLRRAATTFPIRAQRAPE